MGKNRVIDTLTSIIGNVIAHKIVAKHTNKPESVNFLNSEVLTYRDSAIEKALEYHWNADDLKIIEEKSLEKARKILKNKYLNVLFKEEELKEISEETLKEIL
jgi:hypothetical protein